MQGLKCIFWSPLRQNSEENIALFVGFRYIVLSGKQQWPLDCRRLKRAERRGVLAVMVAKVNAWIMAVALMVGMLAGCTSQVREQDALEFSYPAIRKARAKLREGDRQSALALLNRAIDEKPKLAQAHLEVAQLYDDYDRNYVRAIYHYERYLELRPQTEKRDDRGLHRGVKITFAASVAEQVPGLTRKCRRSRRITIGLNRICGKSARIWPDALLRGTAGPGGGWSGPIAEPAIARRWSRRGRRTLGNCVSGLAGKPVGTQYGSARRHAFGRGRPRITIRASGN